MYDLAKLVFPVMDTDLDGSVGGDSVLIGIAVIYGEGVDFAFVQKVSEESVVLRDGNGFKYLH